MNFCEFLWRLDRERISFSAAGFPGQGGILGFLFFKGAGVREGRKMNGILIGTLIGYFRCEEQRNKSYSSFFDCSISLSSF